ncbi:hypothetical protein [Amycolatopsis sp. Poz14]|uniref:hypothetical protein n=1 Tax=Amycolatopsis sp. Poz14 TaxID=1447705 RepID=UPI001EE857C2|nr:hypothetical protein [Amycolatopsis sp. Poz14]MCG3751697.1 hypothetical protein [Amycolatopsis sp. Poz14]
MSRTSARWTSQAGCSGPFASQSSSTGTAAGSPISSSATAKKVCMSPADAKSRRAIGTVHSRAPIRASASAARPHRSSSFSSVPSAFARRRAPDNPAASMTGG